MQRDATERHRTVLLDGDPRAPQQARLGAALAARGHRVIVLDAPEIVRQIEDEFGQRCEALERPLSGLGPAGWPMLVAAARWRGVDVVHLNYLEPRQRPWTLPGAPPYVATVWGSDLNTVDFPRTPTFIAQIDRILAGAAAITADSSPLLAMARQRAGPEASEPSELVFWGVDTEAFDPAGQVEASEAMRHDLGIDEGELVLLAPRQIAPHYHADRVIEAFAQSTWPAQGVLVLKLHGKEGEQAARRQLQTLADGLGVGPRLRFAPRCPYDSLPAVYAMADVGISALEADGVPSTFLELMALEVPVVATELPSYRGVLEPDRAMLVPAGDLATMTAAFDRLCQDAPWRASLATRAREWVVAHADWKGCVDRWEALYEQAIGAV